MSGSLTKGKAGYEEMEDAYDDSRFRCGIAYHSREENMCRGNWPYGVQGTLALLGAMLGSTWIFMVPHSIYQYGAMFLFPYTICLLVLTIPVFYLLGAMGQFSSSGVLKCWMIPIFKGVGVAIFAWTLPVTVLQSTHTGADLYYLHESIRTSVHNSTLPWEGFDPTNNSAVDCANIRLEDSLPETLYYDCHVRSSTADRSGLAVNTPMVLSLLIVWILTCMISCFGIPSVAWVSTVLVPIAFVMLMVLAGLADNLSSPRNIWSAGGTRGTNQLYFMAMALKCALATVLENLGVLVTYCSYNRFHNDVTRDAVAVLVLKYTFDILLTTFFGGLIHHKFSDNSNAAASLLPGKAAGYFSALSSDVCFSIVFFMLVFFLRMLNLVAHLETFVTGLSDQFGSLRTYRPVVVLLLCVSLFLLSVPMATTSGPYLTSVLEDELIVWLSALIMLLILGCFLVYGILTYFRHRHDMAAMTRWNLWCVPSLWVWFACTGLCLVGLPFCLLALFTDNYYNGYAVSTFRIWLLAKPLRASYHLVNCARAFPVVVILLTVIGQLVRSLLWKKPDWKTLLGIIPSWNPALSKHWARVRRYRQMNPYSSSNYKGWHDRGREPATTLLVEGKKQTVVPFYI